MAILSKIRERSMFLIVVVGLALFSFVVSPKDIINFFSNKQSNAVGEVADYEITRMNFAKQMDAYTTNNPNASGQDVSSIVWNQMVSDLVYRHALEQSGVAIGANELWEGITKLPEVQFSPLFKNEAGLFDEEKLKTHLADLKAASVGNPQNNAWENWKASESDIKKKLEEDYYKKFIGLGLEATSQDAETKFLEEKTQLSGQYVYVPYETVADSEVKIGKDQIEAYIKANAKNFQTKAQRDISYVRFQIKPSQADLEDIKAALEAIKNDAATFDASETDSDLPLDEGVKYETQLPLVVKNDIMASDVGAIVGPYEFEGYDKLTKVLEFKNLPDSVKAQHILISFVGAGGADADVTRDEPTASKLADSLLQVITKRKKSFGELAKKFSSDKGSAAKNGDLDWFNYGAMVPKFRDFCFTNKKGKIGIAKSNFGYHIIHIQDQKNPQRTVKTVTYARKINASEKTENEIYQQATTFSQELAKGGNYKALLEKYNYNKEFTEGLEIFSDNIGVLGRQRAIVRWAFDPERAVGDSKRFDVENGYAVVVLENKLAEGLLPAEKALPKVKPILEKEAKFKAIVAKNKATHLDEIAATHKVQKVDFNGLNMASPVIPNVGLEPAVVGAMYAYKKDETSVAIAGDKGVFWFEVKGKEQPQKLPSYESIEEELTARYVNTVTNAIYDALKDKATIKDYRQKFW